MKKKWLVLLLALVMVFTMAACGSNDEPSEDQTEPQDQTEPADTANAETALPQEAYVLMNGVEVRVGDQIADIEDKIGEQTQPSETIQPCDPEAEDPTVEYYYPGVKITTNMDGVIAVLSLDERNGETDSAFLGTVKLGDPVDGIKAVLGEGEEDDMFLQYQYGDTDGILVYKDEEGNDTFTGVVISSNSLY